MPFRGQRKFGKAMLLGKVWWCLCEECRVVVLVLAEGFLHLHLPGDDIYGGMYRLLTKLAVKQGITPRFVPTHDVVAVKAALEAAVPGQIKVIIP